jgi:hypothetical protein
VCWSRVDRTYDTRHWREDAPPTPPPQPATTAGDFRVSDAERQDVIDQLRRHTGAGRLTLDEFESRLDEVMHAKTAGELSAALRELPPPPRPDHTTYRRPAWPRIPVPFMILGVLFVLSLAGGHPIFWILIPFAFCWFGGRGRRHHTMSEHHHDRGEVLTSA